MLPGCEGVKVKELRNVERYGWNEELIRSSFCDRDVKEILSLPGGRREMTDEFIWHFCKNGKYAVKLGYHVLMERIMDFSYVHVAGEWQKLWDVELPPRMMNFVWRLAREILPT
ncbi:hypothetical protein LINPERPRIM_LOCUS37712 [Linum perenne]